MHGPGTAFVLILAGSFYLILCIFSLPISLMLRGSLSRRLMIGLAAPMLGIAFGFLAGEVLDEYNYISASAAGGAVVVVCGVLPVVGLLIWGLRSRMKAQ